MKYYAARPWLSGVFFWTGFDYRGEPTPFGWPNISSDFGILDTCGFPKDVFYYLQSCWSDKTVLHLVPHWNWPGKEGQDIDVWAYGNCEEVELLLNEKSLGKKTMPKNSHLQWMVKYEPGTLSAKGYNGGNLIAEDKVETTGASAGIKLTPDRATIHADGEDLSMVTVAVTDAQGRMVPTASNLVRFAIGGPGKIIGVGNGDPICHEPDTYFTKPLVHVIALDNWHMKKVPDPKDRPEAAKNFDEDKWKDADVSIERGPLKEGESAVFRAHVDITAEDLASLGATLQFGMIDDDGWIYVNGQPVGESHDWRSSPQFDILKLLHSGDNSIAVVVKNNGGDGGINKGVSLDFQKKPISPDWQRSVFNGLAEVIMQAGKEAGEIKLTARADGLALGDVIIHAESHSAHLGVQ
jgi:beta-galactosidase